MLSKSSVTMKAACAVGCLLLIAAAGRLAAAQSSNAAGSAPPTVEDTAHVAQAVQASFYHPDHLGGLDCSVSLDWSGLFQKLNVTPSEDRLKALDGLQVRVQAPRGKKADVTYKWTGEPPAGSDQITDGLQQMLGGFFQMYWPMIASSPISKASDITRLEQDSTGGRKISSISPAASVIITIDDQSTPTHVSFDSPGMKGNFDLEYTPTPSPTPGDQKRITGLRADEQIGSSSLHLNVGLDYQQLGTWHVPHHVTLDLVGAYSIAFDLTGCSALAESR